jgi:hypothetical protein
VTLRSPLGKYGQLVAAVTAIGLIGAYIIALLFQDALRIQAGSLDRLQLFAGVAVGAVFGAASAINGVKEPIDSAHNRIDHIERASGIMTHGSYPIEPPPPDPTVPGTTTPGP